MTIAVSNSVLLYMFTTFVFACLFVCLFLPWLIDDYHLEEDDETVVGAGSA